MQQLDDSELWKVPQEPLPEEPMRDLDEGTQSPDSPEMVDGPVELSPEGRSEAKSVLESAPAFPQRPTSANAGENLPNGELQDLSGNECSPEEATAQAIPVAAGEGDHRPHPGGPEAPSAAGPAGQSPDPSRAPASRQRKLAMEEIVIRDHLGQEVGSMDALGQNQRSLEKEEELEGHAKDGEGQPGPVGSLLDAQEAPGEGEGPLDRELGSRAGPEGESPPAREPQSESGCPQGRGGEGPLEAGSPAREAGGRGEGQKAVPEQDTEEVAPALGPADASTTESVGQGQESQAKTPEGQESGPTEERPGPNRRGSPLEQPIAPPSHPLPPVLEMKDPSSLEEAELPLRDPALLPSPARTPPVFPQDAVPSLQGTEGSLPDPIPSQENEGSLPDLELPSVPSHVPSPPLGQNPSSPGSEGSLLDQTPSAVQEHLPGNNPPSPQDPRSSSLEMRPPSLQGEEAPLQPGGERSVEDQVASSLQEAEGAISAWSQTLAGTQATSLPNQPAAPLPEDEPSVLQPPPPSGHGTEKPAAQQGQELLGPGLDGSLPDTIQASADQPPPLPDQEVSLLDAPSEESPAAPQGQEPPLEAPRVSFLQEADASLPGQAPPPVDENPFSPLDQIPPVLPKTEAASLMGKTTASSLPEADDGVLPGALRAPLPSHPSPDLPEEEGACPDQAPPAPGDQTTPALPGQAPSLQGAAKSLPEGQNAPHPPAGSADAAPPPDRGRSPGLQDTPACPNALPSPSQGTPPPLPDESQAAEGQEAEGRGGASVASVEVPGGELHAETQPLLKEAQATGDLAAAGALPSQAGVSKPQGATGNHTPNNSGSRGSANTAYAHLPRQGQDEEPEKGKRKSCQCCILM